MKILIASLLLILVATAQNSKDQITERNVGPYGSYIYRVPYSDDGVICYVAVESRDLKSVNCVKVK